MGARKPRETFHSEHTRKRIKTGLLVKRMQEHALGIIEMTPSQITAAQTLLRKTVPDLSAVDMNVKGSLEANLIDFVASLGGTPKVAPAIEEEDATLH